MRRFESMVMSETEPVNHGTLWLREKKNTLDPDGPTQLAIWYFGDNGWQPLADFDTRFSITANPNFAGGDKSLEFAASTSPEHGIIEILLDYFIYNGDRELNNNANLVVEAALKLHVDDLQSQITALSARVSTLESQVSTLQSTVATHTSTISGLASRIQALENS